MGNRKITINLCVPCAQDNEGDQEKEKIYLTEVCEKEEGK